MKFKTLYRDLAEILTSKKVVVCDHDLQGYCYQSKKNKGFVVINPKMNYKEKFFTLAHEAGHLFKMVEGNIFVWCDKPRSEDEANWFALQLLRMVGTDVNEYKLFYAKALKKVKTRKKSWFEI